MKVALLLCCTGLAAAGFPEKYRAGMRFMEERQWQRAEGAFADALTYRESPDARRMSRTCRFNLCMETGVAFLKERSYENAIEQFQRALDLDSQSTQAFDALRAAQYQSALRDGMRALALHQDERARQYLERCLEIHPQDNAVRLKLRAIAEWQTAWNQVDACLAAGDAACLDRQIPALAAVGRTDAPLLPALLSYQRGDLKAAEAAARNLSGPSANQFRNLLRITERRRVVARWAPWSAALYGLTLVMGLFFGVRQVRARQLVTVKADENV